MDAETNKHTPLDAPGQTSTLTKPTQIKHPTVVHIASGEKGKARDLLAAIRTLKAIEAENRPATEEEKHILALFPGFGPLPCRSSPTRCAAATRTPAGGSSARS